MESAVREMAVEASPDRRSRFLVFVAWLTLCSYILAIGHYLFVDHVGCAEHGELVHVDHSHGHDHHHDDHHHDDHHHDAAQTAPTPDAESSGAGQSVSPREGDDHEHDHCLVCADRREVVLAAFVLPKVPPPNARQELNFERPLSFVAVRRIYAFAPKTSPPLFPS